MSPVFSDLSYFVAVNPVCINYCLINSKAKETSIDSKFCVVLLDLLTFAWRRPDGNDLFLMSANLLYIFDYSMSMLPFTINTDMLKVSSD